MFLAQWDRARADFRALADLARDMGDARWEVIALDHIGHSFRREDRVEDALGALEPALALSRRIGDRELTARVLNHIGFTYFSDGRNEEALRVHQEARDLLADQDDPEALTESLHGLGENLFFLGLFRDALQQLQASMEMSERLANRSLAGENQYMASHALMVLGDPAGARTHASGSVATLAEIGDVRNLAMALWNSALIDVLGGELGRGLEAAQRGAALARGIHAPRFVVYNLGAAAEVHRELEDHLGADRVAAEAMRLAEGLSGAAGTPWLLAGRVRDAVALGRLDDAERHLREAREALDRTQARVYFPQELAHAEGRLALARGDGPAAAEAARRLGAVVTEAGTVLWSPFVRMLEAAVAWHEGRERAVDLYTDAEREAERLGLMPLRWRALAARADIEDALGRGPAAHASARTAKQIIDRIAAGVADEPLRATFLQSRRVQRVAALAGM